MRRRRFTRTPAFVLAGAPVTTSVVRRDLAAVGHAEGGRSPEVVLLVEPLDAALVEVWSARVQRGAPVRWPGFVRRWAAPPDLPPSADYPALARRWADAVGVEHVHLVVAPERTRRPGRGGPRARRRPGVVRVRRAALEAADPGGGRRRAAGERRARPCGSSPPAATAPCATSRRCSPRGPTTRGPTVPRRSPGLASARAGDLAGDLRAGGYPVHGDLDRIAPRSEGLPGRPSRAAVLRTVVDACLDQAAREHQRRKAGQR